jgi:hypothetical protein
MRRNPLPVPNLLPGDGLERSCAACFVALSAAFSGEWPIPGWMMNKVFRFL